MTTLVYSNNKKLQALLVFINKYNVVRNANLILVEDKITKKIVANFHSGTTEESEAKLQAHIEEFCATWKDEG